MLFQTNIVQGCADIACSCYDVDPTSRGRNDLGFRRQPYVGMQGRDDFHKMNWEPTLVANDILTTLLLLLFYILVFLLYFSYF